VYTSKIFTNPAVLGICEGSGAGVMGWSKEGSPGLIGFANLDVGLQAASYQHNGVMGHSGSTHYPAYTNERADMYGSSETGPGGYFTGETAAVQAEGDVYADSVQYNEPRTHVCSVTGSIFQPASDVDYVAAYGMGGAYIRSAAGAALVAPVNLLHGAQVTKFTAHYKDSAASSDMSIRLDRHTLAAGGYSTLAKVQSSGTPGNDSGIDDTINFEEVDNKAYGYLIYVYSAKWSSDLRIWGVSIEYTISEAP
jgi:hypothetical protein